MFCESESTIGAEWEHKWLRMNCTALVTHSRIQQTIQNGKTNCSEYLLDNGAEVDARDQKGLSSLFYAACEGHTDVLQALLESKADVNE